ncbi:MAG: ShlB/FhaC/HecB family hemolysin secretion/activation protein [Rhodospirillales bacterium]|nr:ShlB/FhaC/HecB family hemolysin secretion/activation protein [Rhodospirillales bacterium]
MLKSSLIAIVILAGAESASAQQVPDAGQQIQQIPQPPMVEKPAPDMLIDRPVTPVEAVIAGPKVRVNSLQVTGETLFSDEQLIAATDFRPGSELNLSDLRNIAARITRFYNDRGYFLAQAYLPAQDIEGGVVTIAVIEGRYGAIDLRNQSRLKDKVAHGVLAGLDSGDIVESAPLERRLLLLSDIPGVAVRSTLAPGSAVGTSDLIVDIVPGRSVTGSIEADNAGNRYTGPYRLGGSIYFNNLTGNGDVASLRVLASNLGLLYGRASYQTLLGNASVGVAYARVNYELGREFESLDADGSADIFSLFGSYPLIRSRNTNLYALGAVEARYLEDRIGVTSTITNRDIHSVTAGFRGDQRDAIGAGGWSTFSVAATWGKLNIETPEARAIDAASSRRNGKYGKLQFSAAHLQQLVGPLSLYGAIRGQIASKNLDSSEQMALGGAYAVRAYPEGEAYGDEGYVANMEARLLLPDFSDAMPGRVQLVGFVDIGAVTLAKDPWYPGSNSAHRKGYGAGIIWSNPNDFLITASYARKLGDQEATSAPDRSGRFWLQFVKLF